MSGIVLRNAWLGYSSVPILKGTNLTLNNAETAVIAGPNGCGKSTLLYACAGLIPLAKGTIEIYGQPVDPTHPEALFRRGVRCGFVFQEGGLMSNMNALANVALALRYHADVLGLTLRDVEDKAKAALDRVRIPRTDFYTLPAHLSFGVRKRLSLARAIALDPNFFFFDDPDVGLDPDTASLVHEILCAYRDDPSVTMLVATNRDFLIERLGVKGYDLHGGQLFERAAPLA